MARLGALERRVMDVLWARLGTELTARQVGTELPGYAYTTVLTVLDRLHKKGLVARGMDGRAHRYRALPSREDYTAALMREALRGVADTDAVLIRFAQTVSASDADVLRRALEEIPRLAGAR